MKKVLIGLAVVVVALLVAAVVVMQSVDFNEYKGLIAEKAKEATGRDLKIEGDLKLDLLTFSPSIAVNGVRFQNASWGTRPDMMVVKRFEAQVAVIPLLSGTVEVKRIVLQGADILVEKNQQGRANYEFEAAKSAEPAKPAAEGGKDAPGQLPVVHAVSVKDSILSYRDAKTGQMLELKLDELSLIGDGASDPLEVKMAGAYNGAPFSAEGTLGAPAEAMNPSRPWPVDMKAEAGGATVTLKGSIARPVEAQGIDLALNVAGQTLATLSPLAGSPVPPIGPYQMTAKMTGDADKQLKVSDLKLVAGTSSIGGTVTATMSGARPRIVAELTSEQISLADFVKEADGSAPTGASAPAAKSASPAPGGKERVIPDIPIPVALLKLADADVELKAKKVLLKDKMAFDDLNVVVRLNNGDLKINPIRVTAVGGTFDGAVRLNGAAQTPQSEFTLKAAKLPLATVLSDMGHPDVMEGDLSIDLDLKGSGDNVRAIAASLGGKADFIMGNGKMKNSATDDIVGGLGKFMTELVAGKKTEYTVVNCSVNRFEATNGLVNTKAMMFDTEYATITGKGTINLTNEVLNMEIDPRPKSATINTAVPVMVQGTMASPQVIPNPAALAGKALGMVGAVAFPPAALLGLGDLGTGEDNPCVAKMKAGASTQPAQPSTPLGQIKEGVGGAVEGVGSQLKGLFGR